MIIKTFEQFLQVLKLQSLADREEEEVNSVSLNLLKPAGVEMFCRTSSECRWGRLTSCLCLCLRCGCVSWTGITTTAFIPSATWRTPRSASVSDSASSDQTSGMFVMSKQSPVLLEWLNHSNRTGLCSDCVRLLQPSCTSCCTTTSSKWTAALWLCVSASAAPPTWWATTAWTRVPAATSPTWTPASSSGRRPVHFLQNI